MCSNFKPPRKYLFSTACDRPYYVSDPTEPNKNFRVKLFLQSRDSTAHIPMLPKRLINEDVEWCRCSSESDSTLRSPGDQFRCRLEGFTLVKRKLILHLEKQLVINNNSTFTGHSKEMVLSRSESPPKTPRTHSNFKTVTYGSSFGSTKMPRFTY